MDVLGNDIFLETDSVYEQYVGRAVEVIFGNLHFKGIAGPLFIAAGLGVVVDYIAGRIKTKRMTQESYVESSEEDQGQVEGAVEN
ncbi:MAG: hypothetical protein EAX81_07595 [Candidatus Thorarchaeota archaeon]|nr:hypothetical protein [Candidatus Thorarchaeota archaeon]